MEKRCEYCGKLLSAQQRANRYCCIQCSTNAKKAEKITAWQKGEFNGISKNGQISKTIRAYLIEKANYKCQLCGWNKINPITQLTPLEIHHIDGNYLNNSEENLQVLCPNCHSLTPNYKSLNDSNRDRVSNRKNYCIDCGVEITDKATRCINCAAKKRITIKPITREELKQLIRVKPFTQIGSQFNVTDGAIRKWCISYGLPSKKKDISQYTDEEWELI